ncbi:MAG TPA: carbon-nitrogen hydrolase family protein [Candidatus Eisenbacteria bacterium]|nr:carbon-nitrogen hydrolase family protein [Candidatus Eisenbacteria bacterium]
MYPIALTQIRASTEKGANLHKAVETVASAARCGARMVLFPEFLMAFSPNAQPAEDLCAIAEPIDGPFVTTLCKAARSGGVHVLATIYETGPVPDRVYDTAVWIDSTGGRAAAYRKLHLYDALGFKESDKFVAGDEIAAPVSTEAGRVGLLICYDLRFPELARILNLSGAEILAAPSGWVAGEMKLEHWRTMVRARALENGCYVLAPDQTGNAYIGHSMAVDPFGRTIVEMDEREGFELVTIDPAMVRNVREKLPLLKNRRADLYAKYLGSKR